MFLSVVSIKEPPRFMLSRYSKRSGIELVATSIIGLCEVSSGCSLLGVSGAPTERHDQPAAGDVCRYEFVGEQNGRAEVIDPAA